MREDAQIIAHFRLAFTYYYHYYYDDGMEDVKVGETGGISVIDFGSFLDGTKKQAVADAMLSSFKKIGFVYLVNHGLPEKKIDNMFAWVRTLPYILSQCHYRDLACSRSDSSISLWKPKCWHLILALELIREVTKEYNSTLLKLILNLV